MGNYGNLDLFIPTLNHASNVWCVACIYKNSKKVSVLTSAPQWRYIILLIRIVIQDCHDESFENLIPDLNYVAIKLSQISNCTKTLQYYVKITGLISCLSFFACLECIVTLLWMCFLLVSKFSLMFWMYCMLFYTPVLLLMFQVQL